MKLIIDFSLKKLAIKGAVTKSEYEMLNKAIEKLFEIEPSFTIVHESDLQGSVLKPLSLPQKDPLQPYRAGDYPLQPSWPKYDRQFTTVLCATDPSQTSDHAWEPVDALDKIRKT